MNKKDIEKINKSEISEFLIDMKNYIKVKLH